MKVWVCWEPENHETSEDCEAGALLVFPDEEPPDA